jgi:hypothetical protein
MFSRGLIQAETDSDLRKTNDHFEHRARASHDGMAPASWSDVPTHALIYLTVIIVTSGAALLAFHLGWGA